MYGPAVRCKRFRQPGRCGLASMYPASDWSACGAPGHHGYQRAFELISGQASNGPFGSPVFACAGKTDPPCLILSQTSAGTRQLGPQGMQALPYGDAPLQQERTDLIDDAGTLTDQSIADAVQRLKVLRPGLRAQTRRAQRGRQGRPSGCPAVVLYRCQAAP